MLTANLKTVLAFAMAVITAIVAQLTDNKITPVEAVVVAIAVVNAVAEERFFRGALPVALAGDHRAVVATAVYVLVTVATLNVALVVAAAAMGTVFMLERLATRGILAPTLTHVTWSTLMLLAIPH